MKALEELVHKLTRKIILLVLIILVLLTYVVCSTLKNIRPKVSIAQANTSVVSSAGSSSLGGNSSTVTEEVFLKIDTSKIPKTKEGDMIRYGRELIVNTAKYLGPNGSVGHFTNGMNCQNCHLDAGTKPFGNNYLSVHSNYPKFRARSGMLETEVKRVSDCMERSLNGKAVAPESKEMLAILAYFKWVGTGTITGEKTKGSGFKDLAYLDRAADKEKGKFVYDAKCISCHMANGEGQAAEGDSAGWRYPPLWGNSSYNDGAGLYRLSMFAKYVKSNMPFGATHKLPQLSDEEAWDVAAYVNSQPRPKKNLSKDWPDISKKPVDHPYGPYSDGFSEEQHKFGPFKPIEEANKSQKKI